MALICYIYQNPVRANIPEGIDYRWSSHQSYIRRAQGLVNVEFILDTLNSNPNKATEQYLKVVGKAVDKPAYKSESEQGKENQKALLKAEMKKRRTELTWEQLVEKITVEEQVNREQLVATRKRLIYEAIERNLMTRTQLAKILQIDPANITRIWQELIES